MSFLQKGFTRVERIAHYATRPRGWIQSSREKTHCRIRRPSEYTGGSQLFDRLPPVVAEPPGAKPPFTWADAEPKTGQEILWRLNVRSWSLLPPVQIGGFRVIGFRPSQAIGVASSVQ